MTTLKSFLAPLMAFLFTLLTAASFALATGGECSNGLCGTPDQSGGGGSAPCVAGICTGGCGSILVAMTDRGDTYQFADDFDGDGIEDEFDNCPFSTNYDQSDSDADGVGDGCDVCLSAPDPYQFDIDGDGTGDLCDPDRDGDGVDDTRDNCVSTPNQAQQDTDGDTEGDVCDVDDDNDGINDLDDACRLIAGTDVVIGCDDDIDGDGIGGSADNCPTIYNPELEVSSGDQRDMDGDGFGDACDLDIDGDGIANFADNCGRISNPGQIDLDHDGLGDGGDWGTGAESCDAHECYVVGGDVANCLDPNTAFGIYAALVGERLEGVFQVGSEITVALFSNRFGTLHNWTARFVEQPSDGDVALSNARGAGATLDPSPQIANCMRLADDGSCAAMNTIRFVPDAPGTYAVKVTAELPHGDALGRDSATFTIVAEVEGQAQGGCAAGATSAFAALALVLFLLSLPRRRRS